MTTILPTAVFSFSDALAFIEKIHTADTTPDEIKETYALYRANYREIEANLISRKWTKKQLLEHTYNRTANDSKAEIAGAILSGLDSAFACGNITWHMMEEKWPVAVQRHVDKWTDETLAAHAAEVAKNRAAALARREKTLAAIEDPQSLDDFEVFIRVKGQGSLTPEQAERYDSIRGKILKEGLIKRREAANTARTVDTNGTEFGAIQETTHTKRGHDLFVVQMGERVEQETFTELKGRAKRLGGYYSSFRGNGAIPGFTFTERNAAEEFAGNEEVTTTENKTEQQAERLRKKAEELFETSDELLNRDRKENTHKRAREAAYAYETARKGIAASETLARIAITIENGSAVSLDRIQHKIDLFDLEGLLLQARRKALSKEQTTQSQRDREPCRDDIRFAEYPWPGIHEDNLKTLCKKAVYTGGLKMAARRLSKLRPGKDGSWIKFTSTQSLENIEKVCRSFPEEWASVSTLETIANYRRLVRLEIVGPATLREALREYLALRQGAKKEDPVKVAERALIGAKIPGFFPTPAPLIERMIDLAGIKKGMTVLEPSAGKGDIAEAARAAGGKVFTIEPVGALREILELKDLAPFAFDFMAPEDRLGSFDAVLMNPPFENCQDIKHVRKAFDHLAEGGTLVAIVSRGCATGESHPQKVFRAWLDAEGGTIEDLPSGSFTSSFRSTEVETSLVVLTR